MNPKPLTFVPRSAAAPVRGRGAVANVAHRFQRDEREGVDDGWASGFETDEVLPPLRTTVREEQARRLLSYNVSPDIPFDRAINPYRGCEHGCTYCYARPTHAYLGYSPGLDFETRLVAKVNAVAALRTELAARGYRPGTVTIGSATDPYQPIERDWQLTRGVLALLDETRHPVVVITKNALIERDLDLLTSLAQRRLVMVFFSIPTLDAAVARTLEPRASAPWRRIQAIQRLSQAGIPTGVMVAPVIPFITDDQLEHVLEAAAQAGAGTAGYTTLRLPFEVREIFTEWLHAHFPDRAERVLARVEDLGGARNERGERASSRFGSRMKGEGIWADLFAQRFALATRRAGFGRRRFDLDTSQFIPPAAPGQQSLF
ncbi:PA0069 family radical SAM protein [Achromobacter sp. GG226]|uniref:PA0069 family radical SAM protein n=1 Tax=Verticiella alkaliphila TaxID=2779529 RepID=UPI001C0B29E7|nr:PA0069 family radical SAM protein [Verticiella sp. GG226]MBU4612707.1 PA0069 family radical SAM protein [Verticiella sp. GG226]